MLNGYLHQTEAVTRRCSAKKVFLKISPNLQKNVCVRVSFLTTLLKERLWERFFPVDFEKLLRTTLFE